MNTLSLFLLWTDSLFFIRVLLRFAYFLVNFVPDLLILFLCLFVSVCQDKESLTFVLYQSSVVVSFLLKTHRLGLVEAIASSHEFVVRVASLHLLLH